MADGGPPLLGTCRSQPPARAGLSRHCMGPRPAGGAVPCLRVLRLLTTVTARVVTGFSFYPPGLNFSTGRQARILAQQLAVVCIGPLGFCFRFHYQIDVQPSHGGCLDFFSFCAAMGDGPVYVCAATDGSLSPRDLAARATRPRSSALTGRGSSPGRMCGHRRVAIAARPASPCHSRDAIAPRPTGSARGST